MIRGNTRLSFKKIEREDETKYFYLNSKAGMIINEIDIDDVFKSIYTTIMSDMQKCLVKSLGWIIDLVINHNISVSKYNPLTGNKYIKVLKDFDNPR